MKNKKGITLTAVIITVVFLLIIVGLVVTYSLDNYNNAKVIKFDTYMRAIQKKVDLILEEGIDYSTIGLTLSEDTKSNLQTIINSNNNIRTRNVDEPKLRYFSQSDIEEIFGLSGISDEVIVNFANRDVISINGVEKEGTTYYTIYTLP